MVSGGAGAPLLDKEKLNDTGVYKKLLASHAITRLGTQGWLFIAPLVLTRFTPDSILGPACWGLVTMLSVLVMGPRIGTWADKSNRNLVITLGVLLQFAAVTGSTAVIIWALLEEERQSENAVAALVVFIFFGIVEKLGTMLSDVSVKREWAPQLFDKEKQQVVNSRMSQIDLTTEVVGPFLAGLLITAGASEAVASRLPSFLGPTDFGFVAVGLLNALSFWPQLALLRSIYRSHEQLLLPPAAESVQSRQGPVPPTGAWGTWFSHPGGLRFVSASYALLYLTVLSPHGALLTAFLMLGKVPSWQLSLLRAAGALLGVCGATIRPALGRCMGERVADIASVIWLAAWMVVAFLAFAATSAHLSGPNMALYLFMAAVCLGRPGLYSFELGVLNTEQELVDKRHRSAIGAIDSALTSLATVIMYGSGIWLDKPGDFGVLVTSSSFFVSLGALTYLCWTVLFKVSKHRHEDEEGHSHGHDHGHVHGASGHEHHPHTLQMEEILEDGWHEHIMYSPSTCSLQ